MTFSQEMDVLLLARSKLDTFVMTPLTQVLALLSVGTD